MHRICMDQFTTRTFNPSQTPEHVSGKSRYVPCRAKGLPNLSNPNAGGE